ncbi:outer membrane protein assembly factor BamE [Denitrificimonas sp. JX-1]|uniref:Outer membrane protein assembly factor BamE n=1 Tax=Denitrificimonas halotolerans TaxID=3098930 RepID=A0ABU5GNR1_9GAMM|nr:outer membrane protein assembly factor BamE [Denitrificimonas sp. JX-1]MDY7218643.1 outer membrane protein assembly factor BamE [Denitrificimonas sp. JX-1]
MQNSSRIIRNFTLASLLVLAGCSFPGVHKIDIQQGNVVTQDMVDQLRPGMTTRQVRYIMGSPLIADTFHGNRWDYLYSIQIAGGTRKQERISLIFDENGLLQGLGGDFIPGISRDQAILGEVTPTTYDEANSEVTTPIITHPLPTTPEMPPAPGSLQEKIQRELDDAEVEPMPTSRLKEGEQL